MATAARAGRNDLCPCGSGKKFKKCCEAKTTSTTAGGRLWMAVVALLVLGGIGAAAILGYAFTPSGEAETDAILVQAGAPALRTQAPPPPPPPAPGGPPPPPKNAFICASASFCCDIVPAIACCRTQYCVHVYSSKP